MGTPNREQEYSRSIMGHNGAVLTEAGYIPTKFLGFPAWGFPLKSFER